MIIIIHGDKNHCHIQLTSIVTTSLTVIITDVSSDFLGGGRAEDKPSESRSLFFFLFEPSRSRPKASEHIKIRKYETLT